MDSSLEPLDPGATPRRPAVFPTFSIPEPIADVASLVLVGATALTVAAAGVEALTFRVPNLARSLNSGTTGFLGTTSGLGQFRQPPLSLSDRLAIFARAGAGLVPALLLVAGIVIVVMAGDANQPDEALRGRRKALMLGVAALACIIVLADIGVCIAVLRSTIGVFGGFATGNRAVSIAQLSAPVGLSVGVLWYVGARVRAGNPEPRIAQPDGD